MCIFPPRLLWRNCRPCRRKGREKSASTITMGHGPSTPSNVSMARTSPSRNDSFVINGNPDPQASAGSISIHNGSEANEPVQNLKSKSYISYRRSTASLSKIFQKKRWKRQRGSISASFNMNENDIRVSNFSILNILFKPLE